jgi:hypothetical protein
VEEQLSAVAGEGQVAEFIQDHQLDAGESFGDLAALAGQFFLFQLVDQIEQVVEPGAASVEDGLPSEER